MPKRSRRLAAIVAVADELLATRNPAKTPLGQANVKLGVRGRTGLAATFAERLPTT